MKTLIYVLSTGKTGTIRLCDALKSIGIDAHHEIVNINSVYLQWMKNRFSSNPKSPKLDVESAKKLLGNELLRYLKGDGYFADISHYLAMLYPIIDSMDIDARSVHLTRSFFPHRIRVYGTFKDATMRIDDNTKMIHRDEVYPVELTWASDIKWEEWVHMSQFERLCHYWTMCNEYFLQGKRKIFHVEDFNTKAQDILDILYPEATKDQKDKFEKTLFFDPPKPEDAIPPYTLKMTDEEQRIYDDICGPTLKKLGY